MLKLADKLTPEKVDAILVRLLPDEKSPRRRMNRLEAFIFSRSQEGRDWLARYLRKKRKKLTEEELDAIDRQAVSRITATLLLEFEMYLTEERYWHERKCEKTVETLEERIMGYQPGRLLARFPQNRGSKNSKNVSGNIYDAVFADKKQKNGARGIKAKELLGDIATVIDWHPELENYDRVSECRWSEELGDWEIVVIKKDGQVIGKPTKTIENVLKEGIIARSRTVGVVSGRKLVLEDVFLGILG